MPLRMNMQSGRKHKSKLDIWENQWSGSLAAPLIFCYPLTKYFEMSELCNNSACFSVEIKTTSDICVTFVVYACSKSEYSRKLLNNGLNFIQKRALS